METNLWKQRYDEMVANCAHTAKQRDEAIEALSGRTVSCSQCNEMAKRIDELEGGSFHSCHDQCKRPACVKRREKDAAIAELNQRLTEQRESFMSQLVRIENGWREKLRDAVKDATTLHGALDDAISLIDRCSIDETPGDFHETFECIKDIANRIP